MPTRNISLTREQDAFVDEIVKTGEYQNASEAVRDALRALQQRRKHDELKIELLRAQIGSDAWSRSRQLLLIAGIVCGTATDRFPKLIAAHRVLFEGRAG